MSNSEQIIIEMDTMSEIRSSSKEYSEDIISYRMSRVISVNIKQIIVRIEMIFAINGNRFFEIFIVD